MRKRRSKKRVGDWRKDGRVGLKLISSHELIKITTAKQSLIKKKKKDQNLPKKIFYIQHHKDETQ